MPAYSKKYKIAKRNYITGKWKLKGAKTKFRAKKVNDKTRLTGRLMSDIRAKNGVIKTPTFKKDGFIIITLYVKKRSIPKAIGLIKNNRPFFGFENKQLKQMKKQVLKRFNKL